MRKKTILVIILIVSILPIYSIDIKASVDTNNYAFKVDGTLNKKIPNFGFNLTLNEEVNNYLQGSLGISRVPGFGNTIWGRMTYLTQFMNVSIGPTLDFLNNDFSKKDFLTLFHPGIGTALSFKTPIGLMLNVETSFAIPLVKVKSKAIYLQNGLFEIGWNLPNMIATFQIKQNNKTAIKNTAETYISVTDIGFHTVTYSKPSRFRIPINIVYRISRYQKIDGKTDTKDSFASIVLGSGLIHSVSTDLEWFLEFGASVYSYSLQKKGKALKKFFFQSNLGIRYSVYKE